MYFVFTNSPEALPASGTCTDLTNPPARLTKTTPLKVTPIRSAAAAGQLNRWVRSTRLSSAASAASAVICSRPARSRRPLARPESRYPAKTGDYLGDRPLPVRAVLGLSYALTALVGIALFAGLSALWWQAAFYYKSGSGW